MVSGNNSYGSCTGEIPISSTWSSTLITHRSRSISPGNQYCRTLRRCSRGKPKMERIIPKFPRSLVKFKHSSCPLTSSLQKEFDKRPSPEQIMKHGWVVGVQRLKVDMER